MLAKTQSLKNKYYATQYKQSFLHSRCSKKWKVTQVSSLKHYSVTDKKVFGQAMYALFKISSIVIGSFAALIKFIFKSTNHLIASNNTALFKIQIFSTSSQNSLTFQKRRKFKAVLQEHCYQLQQKKLWKIIMACNSKRFHPEARLSKARAEYERGKKSYEIASPKMLGFFTDWQCNNLW